MIGTALRYITMRLEKLYHYCEAGGDLSQLNINDAESLVSYLLKSLPLVGFVSGADLTISPLKQTSMEGIERLNGFTKWDMGELRKFFNELNEEIKKGLVSSYHVPKEDLTPGGPLLPKERERERKKVEEQS